MSARLKISSRTWSDELSTAFSSITASAATVVKVSGHFPAGQLSGHRPPQPRLVSAEKFWAPQDRGSTSTGKSLQGRGQGARRRPGVDRPADVVARVPIFPRIWASFVGADVRTQHQAGWESASTSRSTDLRLTNGGRRRRDTENGFLAIWRQRRRTTATTWRCVTERSGGGASRLCASTTKQAPTAPIMSRRCSISMRARRL